LPTIVELSEPKGVVIVGEVGLAIAAIWGDETAANDVLGFAGRGGVGISGGRRNLAGEDVGVFPVAEMPEGVRMWVYVEGEGEVDGLVVAIPVLVLAVSEDECDVALAAVGVVVPALLVLGPAEPMS